jgi:tetratricopeptide (TPR) repeat protein
MSSADGGATGLELAGALFWFWNFRAYFGEGRKLLTDVLKRTRKLGPTRARAKAHYGLGGLAFLQGDYLTAHKRLSKSVRMWRVLGDKRRLGYALVILGMTHKEMNKLDEALSNERESVALFKVADDNWGLALALNDLGNVLVARGNYKDGWSHYWDSLKQWESMGDNWGRPLTLTNLGHWACHEKRYAEAREHFHKALEIQNTLDDKWGYAATWIGLAKVSFESGELERSAAEYHKSFVTHWELGRKHLIAECLEGLANIAGRIGRADWAARLFGAADKLLAEMGKPPSDAERQARLQSIKEMHGEGVDEKKFDLDVARGHGWEAEELYKNVESYVNELILHAERPAQ